MHGKEFSAPAKPWVQPKKNIQKRRIEKLKKEVSELNKDGNIYQTEALDRLDKWVAKEKASKTAATIRENVLLKVEKKRELKETTKTWSNLTTY